MTIHIHYDSVLVDISHDRYSDTWIDGFCKRELQNDPEIYVTVSPSSQDEDPDMYRAVGRAITSLIDIASEYYGGWYSMGKDDAGLLVDSCITCALRVFDLIN
jgi:hypothetical protein